MLPENLVPARFHISVTETEPGEAEKDTNLTQGKRTLSDYASDILANANRTGQSRNMLLEERDRHIKDRLYRIAKIEAFALMLNNLVVQGEISALELSQIMELKTQEINEDGNKIWLNLMTQERTAPLFYNLTEK